MTLTLDLSGDWRVWDNLQPIDYESAHNGGPTTDRYQNCKRRALTKREMAASNGVYTGLDRVWLIPVEMAPELEAKPADTVIDADDTRWTVLEAGKNTFDTWWRLVCRDLVITHDLRDKIDIQRATFATEASGAYVKQFPEDGGGEVRYTQLASRVQPLSEESADERGIRGEKGTYRIFLSRQITVDVAEDRVKWTDRQGVTKYFDILRIENPEQIGELPFLEAVLKP